MFSVCHRRLVVLSSSATAQHADQDHDQKLGPCSVEQFRVASHVLSYPRPITQISIDHVCCPPGQVGGGQEGDN